MKKEKRQKEGKPLEPTLKIDATFPNDWELNYKTRFSIEDKVVNGFVEVRIMDGVEGTCEEGYRFFKIHKFFPNGKKGEFIGKNVGQRVMNRLNKDSEKLNIDYILCETPKPLMKVFLEQNDFIPIDINNHKEEKNRNYIFNKSMTRYYKFMGSKSNKKDLFQGNC